MPSAEGINKLVVAKRETVWGTKATASGAKYYPRVTAAFQLEKDSYQSNAIRPSQQVGDFRHGTRKSSGSLSGELNGSSYQDLMGSALRKDFVAGATTGAVTTISFTATTNLITRSSGSFVTDGFQVGTVILTSGAAAGGNNGLFVILSMSATVLTVAPLAGQVMVTAAAGASVTIIQKGKKTWTPLTGHTNDSYTVEEWLPDVPMSTISLGQQVDSMSFSLQPNAMATVDFGFMGKDAEPSTSSAYFTTPTAIPTFGTYSAPDGFLFINGVAKATVTGINLNVSNGISQVPVVGSNSIGAKSRGKVTATLDLTAILDSNEYVNYFDAETEISLIYVLMTADNSDAFAIYLPRVKLGSATKDDGESVTIISMAGQALEYVGTAVGVEKTTLLISDTTIV